jgi:hypothetical protein
MGFNRLAAITYCTHKQETLRLPFFSVEAALPRRDGGPTIGRRVLPTDSVLTQTDYASPVLRRLAVTSWIDALTAVGPEGAWRRS